MSQAGTEPQSLVQCSSAGQCCKGNGQDVGQGWRLPSEAPKSPSSTSEPGDKKFNISSPSHALLTLIPLGRAVLGDHHPRSPTDPLWGWHSPQNSLSSSGPAPGPTPKPPQGMGGSGGAVSHLLCFALCTAEKAELGKRWQQNTSWATSPKCLGAGRKSRWVCCLPCHSSFHPPPDPHHPGPQHPPDGGWWWHTVQPLQGWGHTKAQLCPQAWTGTQQG